MRFPLLILLATLLFGCATPTPEPTPAVPPVVPAKPLKIALALGGGAARGFAHIGVIKVLEAQGIVPDIIVGTSAGSVVGALYASGMSGIDMQRIAIEIEEDAVTDWTLPDRGFLKGESLQKFINEKVKRQPLEKLAKPFGVVATDLRSGDMVVFRTGNTGMAVRASCAVPGVFQPTVINNREYVDGGLNSPVPVRAAKAMGADFIIAVDIGARPSEKTESTLDMLLQTFTIMGNTISRMELEGADQVIRPRTRDIRSTGFEDRHLAILEGENAALAILPELKAKLARARNRENVAGSTP